MSRKELLFSVTKKDFQMSYFSGKGAGGQHRNRHMNCVRIAHPKSGAKGTGQSERSLERNKREAFTNLVGSDTFQNWLRVEASRRMLNTPSIDEVVESMMEDSKIVVEVKGEDGTWTVE